MNHGLEQFLRNATRGLYGQDRSTVREELRSNIEQLMLEYQEEGDSEQVALARAINEFGNPKTISAGMARVHSVPRLLPRVGMMAVLVALFTIPFGSHHASVLATPWLNEDGFVYTYSIPITELEPPLQRAGIRVQQVQNGVIFGMGEGWTFVLKRRESLEVTELLGALCQTGFSVGIDTGNDQVALLFGTNRIELNIPPGTAMKWRAQRSTISNTRVTDCNDVYTKL
jgi:hypothetical protein